MTTAMRNAKLPAPVRTNVCTLVWFSARDAAPTYKLVLLEVSNGLTMTTQTIGYWDGSVWKRCTPGGLRDAETSLPVRWAYLPR